MNYNWSLEELYASFDSENFKNDFKAYEKHILNFKNWCKKLPNCNKSNNVSTLEEYINLLSQGQILFSKLIIFCNLTISVDTKNEAGLKNLEMLENLQASLADSEALAIKWIGNIDDLPSIINQSILLKEHEFYLNEVKKHSKYMLSEREESVIANMKNTGSSAFAKLRDLLTSTVSVDLTLQGEKKSLPLTVVRNMAYDKDENTRKLAYEAEIASYKKIEDSIAACLNGIKGEFITISKMRGYDSPLDETLINARMDKETLDAMISAMKESFPVFRKYLRRKGEILGHKNGLPFYDLFAPIGESDMKIPYEEGKKFVCEKFSSFSKELSNFADNAIKNSWIDVLPKDGKVGGAFCENIHAIGESRFLLNYGDTFSDVATLAHELGHGYHGECLKNETILNSDYPMPIAETASIFSQTIVSKAGFEAASGIEALSILENEISDNTQVILDIYSRFLFESEVFNRRKESSINAKELCEIMLWAQKEAYGDGLDENYLHPYMWICKPHYYFPSYNFYNFPYAFGLLFAKGLYAEYIKRGSDFAEDYKKLLSITGKNNIVDVTASIGIDIHSVDFWRSSLKTIEQDINKFINLSKNI